MIGERHDQTGERPAPIRVKVELLYRDGSNYKLSASTTFAGRASWKDVLRLQDSMRGEEGMVPTAVGLDCLSFSSGRSEDDHPWHSIVGVQEERGEPQDERTFSDFVDECTKADWIAAAARWDEETPMSPDEDDDCEDDDCEDDDMGRLQ